MSLFTSPTPLPRIPDDLSIPQFFLRSLASPRPQRARHVPWFVEDATGREILYEEVHYRTYALANALSLKWSFQPGDVACLFSPNHVDYPVAMWAVHTLGGIITPANPSFTEEELIYQLTTTRARIVFVSSLCLGVAQKAARACGIPEENLIVFGSTLSQGYQNVDALVEFGANKPENYKALRLAPGEAKTTIAFLSFSSGTTGKPKAVAIPHYSVISNVLQTAAHFRLYDLSPSNKLFATGDVGLAVLPFFHIYGLVVTLHFMLYAGGTVVVVPKFSFKDYLQSIRRYKATHLYLVPPQVVLLCKHPANKGAVYEHVKFVISGAAPLSGDLMKQLTGVFPNATIGQGYGLTESATTICMVQHDRKFGTIGSAGEIIPGIKAKVLKSDGSLASEGEQGELLVTGPSMALGYYKNPEATAETFVDGWVRTGDEVIIRNREVFIVDRLKELIKVRGFQVAPAELEGYLLLHSDVADACVVGVPDEYSGEVPLAFVVLSVEAVERTKGDKVAEELLRKLILKHVADNKVPYKHLAGGVHFVDTIPKNPSGKILRRLLRDKAKLLAGQRLYAKL